MSKGFEGTGELHVASLPGSEKEVYNNTIFCCLEEQLSCGVVWEANWDNLWFRVWKLRQKDAVRAGKRFLVLTKEDGSLGFNQSLEVLYLRYEGIPFQHMAARSLLRQMRPMVQAAWYKDYATVRELLERPEAEELLQQTLFVGYTTLHILARNGNMELTRHALVARAELETPAFTGATPLRIAAAYGQDEEVKVLLEAHANMDAVDSYGCTPLYSAVQNGHDTAAAALITARADIHYPMKTGTTPLIVASRKGHQALVQRLLAARADSGCIDHDGETALDKARREGHAEVEALLMVPLKGGQ